MPKGNLNPVPRSGKNDIAPTIRGAFLTAIGNIEKDTGKTFSKLMQECIEENGLLAVLDRVSKFTVREKKIEGKVNHEHQHTIKPVSESLEWLEAVIDSGQDSSPKEPMPDRPILPATICNKA